MCAEEVLSLTASPAPSPLPQASLRPNYQMLRLYTWHPHLLILPLICWLILILLVQIKTIKRALKLPWFHVSPLVYGLIVFSCVTSRNWKHIIHVLFSGNWSVLMWTWGHESLCMCDLVPNQEVESLLCWPLLQQSSLQYTTLTSPLCSLPSFLILHSSFSPSSYFSLSPDEFLHLTHSILPHILTPSIPL